MDVMRTAAALFAGLVAGVLAPSPATASVVPAAVPDSVASTAQTLAPVATKKRGSLSKKPEYLRKEGAGWRYVRSYQANNRWTYLFTYPSGLAQGEQTSQLKVYLRPRRKQPFPSGEVFYTATARGADPAGANTQIVRP